MRDLKLYLVALLALAYLVTWWALGRRAPRSTMAAAPGPAAAPAPSTAPAPRPVAVTWYTELAPANRPAVQLPAGWRLAGTPATREVSVRAATPVPVRVAPTRRARVRTRSS